MRDAFVMRSAPSAPTSCSGSWKTSRGPFLRVPWSRLPRWLLWTCWSLGQPAAARPTSRSLWPSPSSKPAGAATSPPQKTCGANLVAAKIDGTWNTKLRTYTAPTILVIDDVGLLPMPDRSASSVFFQVVNTRYQKGHPTIVTTNRGLPDWGDIFGDSVIAAAILDRLMHNAVVFNIRGPSWRMREHHGLEIATTTNPR